MNSSLTRPIIIAATCAAILLAIVFSARNRPTLSIHRDLQTATIRVTAADGHPAAIHHVLIKDTQTGEFIYEIYAEKNALQLSNFKLSAGANNVSITGIPFPEYQVVRPANAHTFTLQPGVKYRISIWTDSWLATSDYIQF